jgi:hypothetical protein
LFSNAQKDGPVDPGKDKLGYKGYTIRLIPAENGAYGYAVFNGKDLKIHQSHNPFTMSPAGLDSKEDAYKIAKWQINQLEEKSTEDKKEKTDVHKNKNVPNSTQIDPKLPESLSKKLFQKGPIVNQSISKDIAKELGIKIH